MSKKRGDFWVLTATHGVNDFYAGSVGALLPFLVADRHYTYAAATGITVAATATSSVVQPLFGALSDRYRMDWLVNVGVLTAAVGIGLSGLNSAYWWTFLAVALSGIGVAAYHPSATRVARVAGGGGSHSMSWFSVGGNIGVAFAPALVTIALSVAGLRGTALLVIPAVAIVFVYQSVSSRTPAVPPSARVTVAAARPDDWRAFSWLTIVSVCWSVPYVAMTSFAALYVIARFQTSAALGAVALTTFAIAGAVGTVLGGNLADRFGRLIVIRSGYAIAALAIGAVIAGPGLVVVIAGIAVLGVAIFLPFASQITLAHDYLPNRIGVASGVTLGLTLSVGGLLAPILGAVADAHGIRVALLGPATALLLAFLLSWKLTDRAKAVQEHSSLVS